MSTLYFPNYIPLAGSGYFFKTPPSPNPDLLAKSSLATVPPQVNQPWWNVIYYEKDPYQTGISLVVGSPNGLATNFQQDSVTVGIQLGWNNENSLSGITSVSGLKGGQYPGVSGWTSTVGYGNYTDLTPGGPYYYGGFLGSSQLHAPTVTTGGPLGGSGTLPGNKTYFYVATYINENGETPFSNEVAVYVPAGSSPVLSANITDIFDVSVGAPTTVRFYRGTSLGGENVYYNIPSSGSFYEVFTDTGATPDGYGTPPKTNTTGQNLFSDLPVRQLVIGCNAVVMATGYPKQLSTTYDVSWDLELGPFFFLGPSFSLNGVVIPYLSTLYVTLPGVFSNYQYFRWPGLEQPLLLPTNYTYYCATPQYYIAYGFQIVEYQDMSLPGGKVLAKSPFFYPGGTAVSFIQLPNTNIPPMNNNWVSYSSSPNAQAPVIYIFPPGSGLCGAGIPGMYYYDRAVPGGLGYWQPQPTLVPMTGPGGRSYNLYAFFPPSYT